MVAPDKNSSADLLRRCAALLGATGVAAGAFGAHALKEKLSQKPGRMDNWRTAVMYQLIHATAVLALSTCASSRLEMKDKPKSSLGYYITGGKMMTIGTMMFSGSIYGLCLDIGPKRLLGPITPLGGLLMIGGWAVLGFGG